MSFVRDAELLDLLSLEPHQLRRELDSAALQISLDGPILALLEPLDLVFALDDHPQGRALHPPRRQPPANLLPQQGRQVEADEVIERPARLLGIDERGRDLAGTGNGLVDRALGDLVEDDPVHRLRVEHVRIAEKLGDVPRDRLAFPVGISRQIERFRLLHRAAQGVDVLRVARDGLVVHQEAVLRLDRTVFGNQIPHMPVRGKDFEVGSQVLLDRSGLGGRFNNQEVSGHRLGCSLSVCRTQIGCAAARQRYSKRECRRKGACQDRRSPAADPSRRQSLPILWTCASRPGPA